MFGAEIEKSLMERDAYYDALSKLNTYFTAQLSAANSAIHTSVRPGDTKPEMIPVEPKVNLPKIELPKFDGNIMNWPTFWDQYESSVHMQPCLSGKRM